MVKLNIIVFSIICIINTVAVYSGYLEYELLEALNRNEYVTDDEAMMNDLRQASIGISQSILYLLSGIFFLIWFRRAFENLHLLGIRFQYSINSAVWSFFVPILCLYRPYQIMKEIWFGTQAQIKKLVPQYNVNFSTKLISIWWVSFIITNYLGYFALKSMLRDDTIGQLIDSAKAYIISDIFDIPAAILAILVIKIVSNVETQLYEAHINENFTGLSKIQPIQ